MALASVSRMMSLTRSRTVAGRCSYSRFATKRASSAVGVSVELGTGILDSLSPLHDLGLDERSEFFGRGNRGFSGEVDEALAHLGGCIDLRYGAMDFLHDGRRNAGGSHQAVPADGDITRQRRFIERRHVGKRAHA